MQLYKLSMVAAPVCKALASCCMCCAAARMSDLLLPFVLLMEDDALAFWCFVALMQRQGLRRNFAADESGIFAQLRCLGQVRPAERVSSVIVSCVILAVSAMAFVVSLANGTNPPRRCSLHGQRIIPGMCLCLSLTQGPGSTDKAGTAWLVMCLLFEPKAQAKHCCCSCVGCHGGGQNGIK